jgi:hypothetical protein
MVDDQSKPGVKPYSHQPSNLQAVPVCHCSFSYQLVVHAALRKAASACTARCIKLGNPIGDRVLPQPRPKPCPQLDRYDVAKVVGPLTEDYALFWIRSGKVSKRPWLNIECLRGI